jgi:O-antigen ligase
VPQADVTIIMASSAIVALGLLVHALRVARAARDLDASTALTLGMAWLTTLPLAVVAFSGGVTRRLDAFRQLVAFFPGWYSRADRLALLLIAALAVVLLVRRVTSVRVPVHAAGLFAIALWMLAHLSAGLHGGRLLTPRGVVVLVCLIAATVLPRGRGACLGAGIFGVTLAIGSGALAVFHRDAAFVVPCVDSCGGLGLTGLLPNPDLLGVALAACIPFAYLGFRGRARPLFALYLAGMAIATGSQTATASAAVAVAALFIVRPRLDADEATPGRAAIAGLVLAGAVVAMTYFPLHHWDPSALSDRPLLWRVAAKYIDQSPWVGYGQDKWPSLYQSSEIFQAAQRSAHNQWMDVLFASGWLGAALLVSVVIAALWSSGRARPGVALAVATMAMIGTTEGAWAVGTFDILSFSLVALILTGATRHAETPSPARAGRPSRVVRPRLQPVRMKVREPAGGRLCSRSA